jgi:hypothetical protein
VPSLANLALVLRKFLDRNGGAAEDVVDWLASSKALRDWDRRDVYQVCLNRLPEFRPAPDDWQYANDRERAEHIVATLTCTEFRQSLVANVSATMPWVRRLFFVHIPRTAGTSVGRTIASHSELLVWHESYVNDEWFNRAMERLGCDPLTYAIRFLAQFCTPGTPLLVMGHVPVSVLLSERLLRARDEVFTIVRPPLEIILSNLAYMVEVALGPSEAPDAIDWREWFRCLGCKARNPTEMQPQDFGRIVRSARFGEEYGNPINRYLSLEEDPRSVADLMAYLNIKVLTAGTVSQYLRERLGVTKPLRLDNASNVGVRKRLVAEDMAFIRKHLIDKDLYLWRRYDEATRSFGPSVRPRCDGGF